MLVYYAINKNPTYFSFVINSMESLRRFNKEINICLFIFDDDITGIDLDSLRKYNVWVTIKEPVEDSHLTSLKWFALEDLKNIEDESILYADADTYFFGDVRNIFEMCNEHDFYAREEFATGKQNPKLSIGSVNSRHTVDHKSYEIVNRGFKSAGLPIFNTGVMLFNNNVFKKVSIDFYKHVLKSFLDKKIPYPSLLTHMLDEVTGSITLGKIKNFSYSLMDKKISPWYLEFKENEVTNPGIVMHIWTANYISFINDLEKLNRLMDN